MATATRGYIRFSEEWEHLESQHVGPFLTRIVHRRPDGTTDIRTSRRHRKGFGPEREIGERKRSKLLVYRPNSLNWWVAVMFMVGSWHFIAGSVMGLAGSSLDYLMDAIFFSGSVFFTCAGYSQYYQAINAPEAVDDLGREQGSTKVRYLAWQPHRIDFWATFPQFLGTLAFNLSTFAGFLDVQWLGYDLLVWVPDYVGSILFLVAGTAGVLEFCHRAWCWQRHSLAWWSIMFNFWGCVAFMISAVVAFVRPNPIFPNLAFWATLFTLIGAVCFFVCAYLTWPEMAAEEEV